MIHNKHSINFIFYCFPKSSLRTKTLDSCVDREVVLLSKRKFWCQSPLVKDHYIWVKSSLWMYFLFNQMVCLLKQPSNWASINLPPNGLWLTDTKMDGLEAGFSLSLTGYLLSFHTCVWKQECCMMAHSSKTNLVSICLTTYSLCDL